MKLAFFTVFIDLLIIWLTIRQTANWGDWESGTIWFFPETAYVAWGLYTIGIAFETAVFMVWSPALVVQKPQNFSERPRKQ